MKIIIEITDCKEHEGLRVWSEFDNTLTTDTSDIVEAMVKGLKERHKRQHDQDGIKTRELRDD